MKIRVRLFVNTMVADDLKTQGANASLAMLVIWLSRIILFSIPERSGGEFIYLSFICINVGYDV